jgi:glycosyltransferase involved in cell wall biosynthesis
LILINVGYDREIFLIQKFGGVSRAFSSLMLEFSSNPDLEVRPFPTFNRTDNEYLLNKNQDFNFMPQRHFFQARSGWSTLFTYGPIREISSTWAAGLTKPRTLDLLHATYYRPNKLDEISSKNLVITVHDFIPESLGWFGPRNPHIGKKKIANKADMVICVSENTKNETLSRYKIDENRLRVIHHGVDMQSRIEPKKISEDLPYLLFVGHRNGYKNFQILLDSFKEINAKECRFQLIIVGPELSPSEIATLNNNVGPNNWLFLPQQNDEELRNLYSRAFAHIVTSKMEGFGMTILESMAVATPVVLSDIPVFREIAGEAGTYFDTSKPESLTQALNELCEDEIYRSKSLASIENARKFSWHKAAKLHADVYRLVMN